MHMFVVTEWVFIESIESIFAFRIFTLFYYLWKFKNLNLQKALILVFIV